MRSFFVSCLLFLVLCSTASAKPDITWMRNNVVLRNFGTTTPLNDEVRGTRVRNTLLYLAPLVLQTDTLICRNRTDFGKDYVTQLPVCNYKGDATTEWIGRCTIDNTATKPYSSPSFLLGSYAKFVDFKFTGNCWNKQEDGGLIGWGPDGQAGDVYFENCSIDGREGMDWLIYSWASNFPRTITISNCTIKYCRIAVAFAGSGNSANQIATITNSKFYGDANGSQSYGATSLENPVTGGVLTGVLNRAGSTTIENSRFEAVGLLEQYDNRPTVGWGCPRVASIFTNQYYSGSGQTSTVIKNCTSKVTPNIAAVWNDVDVRSPGVVTVFNDPIGSAEDGSIKQF